MRDRGAGAGGQRERGRRDRAEHHLAQKADIRPSPDRTPAAPDRSAAGLSARAGTRAGRRAPRAPAPRRRSRQAPAGLHHQLAGAPRAARVEPLAELGELGRAVGVEDQLGAPSATAARSRIQVPSRPEPEVEGRVARRAARRASPAPRPRARACARPGPVRSAASSSAASAAGADRGRLAARRRRRRRCASASQGASASSPRAHRPAPAPRPRPAARGPPRLSRKLAIPGVAAAEPRRGARARRPSRRSSSRASTASGPSRAKRTARQRERTVSSSASGSALTRIRWAKAGGSSSVFSSAFWLSSAIASASSITNTRRSPSNGR